MAYFDSQSGGALMANGPQLTVSPVSPSSVINWGPVLVGDPYTFGITLANTGNQTLTFGASGISITPGVGASGDFSFSGSIPTSLAAGASQLIFIEFNPTSPAGTTETATLAINSNSVGGNVQYTLQGLVAATTDDFLQLQQIDVDANKINPVVAFGLIPPGEPSLSNTLRVANRTSSTQTATLTPLTASGYSIINEVGVNPIPAGQYYQFQLQLIPAAGKVNQDDVDAVIVTVPSQTATTDFEATYSTAPITPAYTLTDDEEAMLLGFFNAAGQVAMLQADPLDINCEENALAMRQYAFGGPSVVASLSRLLTWYERLGPCTVTVTYSSLLGPNNSGGQPPQVPVVTTIVFDPNDANDGLLKSAIFDGVIAGDIISIEFGVAANSGRFSLTLFMPYYEPRGEEIENT
jgi:hypothetical protein